MPNTNAQTIHQMGSAINSVVRQATGRDAVGNIDMDFVTVAQNKTVLSVSDRVPYLRRRTGDGVNIGNATLARDKIIGGSLAWNQLQRNENSLTSNGITFSYLNGTLAVSGTASAQAWWIGGQDLKWDLYPNHIYFVDVGNADYHFALNTCRWYIPSSDQATVYIDSPTKMFKPVNKHTAVSMQFTVYTGYEINESFIPQMFDLTQMFGTTVADYIYSLETANAGAGVSFFREFFPNDYYDYNAGELKSVEGLQSHKTTGEGWERTYPLDPSLTLRGIPKLDSNNKLYYDGDEYSPDGTVTRRYGIVDLGTLTWGYYTNYFQASLPLSKPATMTNGLRNVICDKYTLADNGEQIYSGAVDKKMIVNSTYISSSRYIAICDSAYTDSASFKSAMSGVYLVYELAEPTTETATTYTDPQEVSANGTEQYVTNSIIPVGHETEYLELVEV